MTRDGLNGHRVVKTLEQLAEVFRVVTLHSVADLGPTGRLWLVNLDGRAGDTGYTFSGNTLVEAIDKTREALDL